MSEAEFENVNFTWKGISILVILITYIYMLFNQSINLILNVERGRVRVMLQ